MSSFQFEPDEGACQISHSFKVARELLEASCNTSKVFKPGKPTQYGANVEAQISVLACSSPPEGATRWTLELLEQAAHALPDVGPISRETIRRLLKKTASNRGAS